MDLKKKHIEIRYRMYFSVQQKKQMFVCLIHICIFRYKDITVFQFSFNYSVIFQPGTMVLKVYLV